MDKRSNELDNKSNELDNKSGLQSNSMSHDMSGNITTNDLSWNNNRKRDEDLIIDDNTVYEIDRDCYERLKKQRYSKSIKNDIGRWNVKR